MGMISDLFENNSVVQRLATGELTDAEKRGYSEEGLKIETSKTEGKEPRKISFGLTQDQKLAVFQDVKTRVIDGVTPDDIGKAVVACIEEHLSEKEEEAYGAPELKKGLIRRVDE